MGMYTKLNLGLALEKDTPLNVIQILRYMVRDADMPDDIPDHPLFETDRWDVMLVCGSGYFDDNTHTSMECDCMGRWILTARSDFKNYCGEIDKFLNFIQPYLNTDGFIGYSLYEEDDDPILIYNIQGRGIVTKGVKE